MSLEETSSPRESTTLCMWIDRCGHRTPPNKSVRQNQPTTDRRSFHPSPPKKLHTYAPPLERRRVRVQRRARPQVLPQRLQNPQVPILLPLPLPLLSPLPRGQTPRHKGGADPIPFLLLLLVGWGGAPACGAAAKKGAAEVEGVVAVVLLLLLLAVAAIEVPAQDGRGGSGRGRGWVGDGGGGGGGGMQPPACVVEEEEGRGASSASWDGYGSGC